MKAEWTGRRNRRGQQDRGRGAARADEAARGDAVPVAGARRKAGKGKHMLYLALAAGMLLYASTGIGHAEDGAARAFWLVWLAFSAVIVAANVNVLLMSDAKRDRLASLKREKMRRWERAIEKRVLARYEARARGGAKR